MHDTTGFRGFTVHEEKGLTGNFRIARDRHGEFETQCEVEVVKVRTMEQRSTYKTFRRATPEEVQYHQTNLRSHRV